MKTALVFGLILLPFLGITKAAAQNSKAPQIVIEAKFAEVGEREPNHSESAPLPAPLAVRRKVAGVAGNLRDPEYQALLKQLNTIKGFDLLSAPLVTTRSGRDAKIEIVRELTYKDQAGKPVTAHLGVTLDVLPKITADQRLQLILTPQLLDIEGWICHKSGWQEPTFSRRKMTADAALTSGESVILEMPARTDSQMAEGHDGAAHVIRSHRRLLVFVTARQIDPTPAS